MFVVFFIRFDLVVFYAILSGITYKLESWRNLSPNPTDSAIFLQI